MGIRTFLPKDASALELGDLIYVNDGSVHKIVKIQYVEDDEHGDHFLINLDTTKDGRGGLRNRGCRSTYVLSEVSITYDPANVFTKISADGQVMCLLELSDKEIEAIQSLPLLPLE